MKEMCHKWFGTNICKALWLTRGVDTDGLTSVYVKDGVVQVWERWRLTSMVDKNANGRWCDG